MSYSTLELVGENVTVDLLDGANYALVDWAPAVSSRSRQLLGNYSPYEDVVEKMTVNVYGTSVAEALDKLDAINIVLEQADAWRLGDSVSPVLVRVRMTESALTDPLEAVVVGRPDSGPSVMLQPTFNHDILLYEIAGVEISFIRKGLWLGPEAARSLSGSLTNPAVMTVAMPAEERRLSPTTVRITGFSANTRILGGGYLLIGGVPPASPHGNNIAIHAAAAMSSGEFSVVDDATNHAHGGNVMRIDASSNQTGALTLAGVNTNVSRVSVFAAVRNNSMTATWRVRAASTGYVRVEDGWRIIDSSSQKPRIIHVGSLVNQSGAHLNIQLEFSTTAVTGTLDVNYVVVFGEDASTGYILIADGNYSSESFPRALVVDPRAATHRTPLLYAETVAGGA